MAFKNQYAPVSVRVKGNSTPDENGCWLWDGMLDVACGCRCNDHYGLMKVNSTTVKAHRAAYEAFVGPIPEGLVIDHVCQVKRCVNPEHLEPVTRAENSARVWTRKKENES